MFFFIFLLHLAYNISILKRERSLKADKFLTLFLRSFLAALMLVLLSDYSSAKDFLVTGKVTDASGNMVPNARISMLAGNAEFAAVSNTDGSYSLRISGIYDVIRDLLESGIPYPNPFTYFVNIPFIINSSGDIRFAVYSLAGQKIREVYLS